MKLANRLLWLLLVVCVCMLLAPVTSWSSPLQAWRSFYPPHSSPAEPKVIRGDSLFNAVETEAAQKAYTEAIAIDPKFAPAYGNRARTWLELGKNKQALDDLELAMGCANKRYRITVWRDRADIRKALKDYVAAERDYKGLVEAGGHSDGVFAALAECALKLNKPKDALEDLKVVEKIRPDAPYIWRTRLECLIMLKDYDRALTECNRLLTKKSEVEKGFLNNARIYEERAHVYDAMGKQALAAKDRLTAKQMQSQNLNEMPFMTGK